MNIILEEIIEKIAVEIPGRSKQIDALLSLLGFEEDEWPSEAVFLYGRSGTGKSFLITKLLQYLNTQHSRVNCLEVYGPNLFYHMILKGFEVGDVEDYKCANFYSFLSSLQELVSIHLNDKQNMYIVLENADHLPQFSQMENIIAALVRLQEFTKLRIGVVFISQLAWGNFFTNSAICDPSVIYFPEYTYDELVKILSLHRPRECSEDLYDGYVKLLLRIFCPVTRNTRELLHMAKLNFKEYCRPIAEGRASESDVHKLWKNVEPHLKKALDTVYLRTVSSSQWEKAKTASEVTPESNSSSKVARKQSSFVELPFYSKFLLTAAYIASYNSQKTDKKHFVKNQGKVLKKTKTAFKTGGTNCHISGPKTFSLDRLLAIFYSIVDDNVIPSALILSQVSSLVSLRLLTCVNRKDPLTNPKYKCLATWDCVNSVSKTINFDLVRYLDDFA